MVSNVNYTKLTAIASALSKNTRWKVFRKTLKEPKEFSKYNIWEYRRIDRFAKQNTYFKIWSNGNDSGKSD